MFIEDIALAYLAANKTRSTADQFRIHWPDCLPDQYYIRVDDPWADNIISQVLRTVWFGLGRREGIWLTAHKTFLEPRHTLRWASFIRDADAMLDGELLALAHRVGNLTVINWFNVTEEPGTADWCHSSWDE